MLTHRECNQGKDINLVLQLLRPDNRHHFMASAYGTSNSQIICLDEIKMNLLGKSCLCPGFSTFICNLMVFYRMRVQVEIK